MVPKVGMSVRLKKCTHSIDGRYSDRSLSIGLVGVISSLDYYSNSEGISVQLEGFFNTKGFRLDELQFRRGNV
jgi:hypothetical protein